MPGMKAAATVDDYLKDLPADQRAALELLRTQIHAAAPDATEVVAYGIPGFRLRGRYFVGFGAAKKHCAFYCGTYLRNFDVELAGYTTLKGTIRFTPDKPIPPKVVKAIVKARVADFERRERR